jgi:hypothetical protein
MKLTTALTLATLTFASPVLAQQQPVAQAEVCRPKTDNLVQTVTQAIAYPFTQPCTRPYIRLHNDATRSTGVGEAVNNFFKPVFTFQDESGNRFYPCPTPTSANQVCSY